MKDMQYYLDCVGTGWHSLVKPLLERAEREGVEVLQVKEKFGGLRFYVEAASPEFHAAIRLAEDASFTLCEECGLPGKCQVHGGKNAYWVHTFCPTHCHEYCKQREDQSYVACC